MRPEELAKRLERLHAATAIRRGGNHAIFERLICDRCKRTVDLAEGPPGDLGGWGAGPEGDLCPACAA